MEFFDRHLGVLGSEFDERHAAAGLETCADRSEHFFRVRQFVVDVDHQHQVDGVWLESRVDDRAQPILDVVDLVGCRAILEQSEHLALDVDGNHATVVADQFGERQRVKAVAATHVADCLSRLHVEGREHRLAILFPLARLAYEPRCTKIVHGRGDLPTIVFCERRWNRLIRNASRHNGDHREE